MTMDENKFIPSDVQIIKTLPCKSQFIRRDLNSNVGEQAVAANFDYVLIMNSLNKDFNDTCHNCSRTYNSLRKEEPQMIEPLFHLLKKPMLWQRSTEPFWDDEHISKGMLEAHLNPDLDAARNS